MNKLKQWFNGLTAKNDRQEKEIPTPTQPVKEVELTEPKPKVIYFNKEQFDNHVKNIEYVAIKLSKIFKGFKKIAPRELTMDELKKCFVIESPTKRAPRQGQELRELLLDIHLEFNESKMFGAKLDRETAKKLIQLPKMRNIQPQIAELCFNPIPGADALLFQFFKIDNGELIIDPEKVEAFKNKCTIFTGNDTEKTRLNITEGIIQQLCELEKETDTEPGSMEIPGVIVFDKYIEQYRPEISIVTNGINT